MPTTTAYMGSTPKRTKVIKTFTKFIPKVRSSQGINGSHYKLMSGKLYPFRSIVRFGSVSRVPDLHRRVEVNTVEAIRNASNKMRMKEIFTANNIKSTKWMVATASSTLPTGWKFPIVAKLCYRSGGKGMVKIDTPEQLTTFINEKIRNRNRETNPYYFEEFVNCKREYRIHVSQASTSELFSVRKLVSENIPKEKQWIKSISNGAFVEEFEKPQQWTQMVNECKKALVAIKLDIGCFDVKYKKSDGSFYLLEVNSSPAMGDKTKAIYINEIDKILKAKYQSNTRN